MAVASRSAVMVTLVRAHLTWMGVVDDPCQLRARVRAATRDPSRRPSDVPAVGRDEVLPLPVEDAPAVLDKAGWTVDRVLTAPDLRSEFLDETPMPATSAFIATATR